VLYEDPFRLAAIADTDEHELSLFICSIGGMALARRSQFAGSYPRRWSLDADAARDLQAILV